MSALFVDTSIPMYAAGADHPHKAPAGRLIRRIAAGEVEAVTDAEVFQEILHRYRAIGRLAEGLAIYDSFRAVVPVILAVSIEIVDDARSVLESQPALGSRDALHVAVMRQAGLTRIASFDEGFDAVPGLRRVRPT